MTGISYAVFSRLTCHTPEDVGGDETKLTFTVDSNKWDATSGRAIDQVNEQLVRLFRVQGGFDVTPQVPNKGVVLVWKPPRSRLPVKAGESFDINWLVPFVDRIDLKLYDRDKGFLEKDDYLGKETITSAPPGIGGRTLGWKGGSGLVASRFHYTLRCQTSSVPESVIRSILTPDRRSSVEEELSRVVGGFYQAPSL